MCYIRVMTRSSVNAGVLRVTYEQHGHADGWPCVLGHGFPYDVHAYADVAPILAAAGARVIVPYLRGFGATRFLDSDAPRSGEQAALGADLIALMDALGIERAVLGGYDWGGRAACVVSALWPERVVALVSGNAYNIQNIARAMEPATPAEEAALWYQYYFHSERGRIGLTRDRRGIARLLWRLWSPTWAFDEATFERTAGAFYAPDFVDVVIHSYRHRFGLVAGDPAYAEIEARLATQPPIRVPAVTIDGTNDGVNVGTAHHARKFLGAHERRLFDDTGHNLPQEQPQAFAQAVIDAREMGLAGGAAPLVIRDARADEFEAIGRMMVAAYSGLEGFPKPESQPDAYKALTGIGDEAAKPDLRLLVALEKEQIAGAVVFYPNMAAYRPGGTAPHEIDAAGLRFLAADPEARGRGIAKALIEHCVALATAGRRRGFVVHATDAMKAARAILAARGFKRAPDLDFVQGSMPVYGYLLPL
jgi:pimeloyl-ACP methyl ester carboxylesterase/GNAT superfamily N-acetyltransferase